jgi:hypothetical protein
MEASDQLHAPAALLPEKTAWASDSLSHAYEPLCNGNLGGIRTRTAVTVKSHLSERLGE